MEPLLEKVNRVNGRLGTLLGEARQALRGEQIFGVSQVRELSRHVAEMEPVCRQAGALRLLWPDVEEELELYRAHLGDLHVALRQVQAMLLAQRAQMEASRAQLAAVSQWVNAMQQTR